MWLPGLLRAGQDRGVPVECEGSLLASFCADREKGSGAVPPVAIVWPCPLAVDAHVAAGRDVGFPRPSCPSCAGPLVFWSGTGVMGIYAAAAALITAAAAGKDLVDDACAKKAVAELTRD